MSFNYPIPSYCLVIESWQNPVHSANEGDESAISLDRMKQLRERFYRDPKNVVAQNACCHQNPWDAAISRREIQELSHVFNIKIDMEAKPVTAQKKSGTCWLFAALNMMRLPFMKQYTLDTFEFSQSYLFFCDKIERSNYFLTNIIDIVKKGEPLDGRLFKHLLTDPMSDGGQWDMFMNLIDKYGVMPQKCYPEAFCMGESVRINALLNTKLREYAKQIRAMILQGASDEAVKARQADMVATIHNICGICLGIPAERFTYEFYGGKTDKVYTKIGPVTPQEFYQQHVKPVFNVDEKICLVNDPRSTSPYNNLYTMHCLGNVVGGKPVIYNNQPMDVLIKATHASLADNEAVWFGCDVNKRFDRKLGVADFDLHDMEDFFGTDFQTVLDKADRLLYGDSIMTHAMLFTACSENEEKEVTRFRAENSWSEEVGQKGYLMVTTEWVREFVFEVVVDKKYLDAAVLDVMKKKPIVLPAWDPMGTLAKS